ncbi:unnamed protein product [Rhizophagus irregularis]|nr:unnamed protein product [Rhizophagus irregularis]
MTKGYSLEQDLRLLINNPKYSDIKILCKDKQILHGCRAILAARCEVFDKFLYNGRKESYENHFSFPNINSSEMEIILEYIYSGSIKVESLNKENIVEAFYAADYFQLLDLQKFIMETIKSANYAKNYSPELLSKVVNTIPLSEDNILLNLLVESVATIPLNTVEFGRLSIKALQHLLSYTYNKETPFATPEYEVFRYAVILAAKQVSNSAYKILMERLPTLEQMNNSIQIEIKFIDNNQISEVTKELEPLVEFIDFRRIKRQIFADLIDPLEIIPTKIILNVYRYIAKSNSSDLNDIRGIPTSIYKFNESDYVWDESACGSNLIIEDNGKVVRTKSANVYNYQSVRAKLALENENIFEWDVIIEKVSVYFHIGVCTLENFESESWVSYGWVLCSDGKCCNFGNWQLDYCPEFINGARITVHLDMNKRTCAFTVDGTKYPVVSTWNNLPSKLYPVVSFHYPGRFRIQPHQKS